MTPEYYGPEVPWKNIKQDPFDLTAKLASVGVKTAIDVGSGLLHSPISTQIRTYPFERLTLVDAYKPYVDTLAGQSRTFAAQVVDLHVGCAQDILSIVQGQTYDAAILLDIVEHLHANKNDTHDEARPVALKFLKEIELVARNIFIFIPLGYCPIDRDPWGSKNDEGHKHYTTWVEEDLLELGYGVESWPGFHDPHVRRFWTPGHEWHCNGGWCFKRVSG